VTVVFKVHVNPAPSDTPSISQSIVPCGGFTELPYLSLTLALQLSIVVTMIGLDVQVTFVTLVLWRNVPVLGVGLTKAGVEAPQ
jgi:hypothetical protein